MHPQLELVEIDRDFLRFKLDRPIEGRDEPVEVNVRIAGNAVSFPHIESAGGQSLGDEESDESVRRRAREWLVMLRASAGQARRTVHGQLVDYDAGAWRP